MSFTDVVVVVLTVVEGVGLSSLGAWYLITEIRRGKR